MTFMATALANKNNISACFFFYISKCYFGITAGLLVFFAMESVISLWFARKYLQERHIS